jgi:hypothetical protein
VIGGCEETCTNLDIAVHDGNDDISDADFEPDTSPVIFLEAASIAQPRQRCLSG